MHTTHLKRPRLNKCWY